MTNKDKDSGKDEPCSLSYAIVGKTKTIKRHSMISYLVQFSTIINPLFRFIRETLGYEVEEANTSENLEKVHKTQNGQISGDNGDHINQSSNNSDNSLPLSQRFFSLLQREDVEGLIQKYQIDLEMWGYSTQQYLELSK